MAGVGEQRQTSRHKPSEKLEKHDARGNDQGEDEPFLIAIAGMIMTMVMVMMAVVVMVIVLVMVSVMMTA
ncbi:hypothetical protein JCM16163A_15330 [Paenibacillus sp. YK5]|nr:hypothetical protein PN4B1_39110 [Paenibacillus naphthalenovorans]